MDSEHWIKTRLSPEEYERLADLGRVLKSYGVPVGIGLVLFLAITMGVSLHRKQVEKRIDEAAAQLSSANSLQAIEAIVEQDAKTPSAPLALLKLAKIYYNAGNYDLAMGKYAEFKLRFPGHPMELAAELGRIHSLEGQGLNEQALQEFRAFADAHPQSYLVPQALFGQARCLEQLDRLNEAKAVYEDFIVAHPKSGWLARAEDALETINQKLKARAESPSAEATNAPPTAVAATVPVAPPEAGTPDSAGK